MFSLFSLVFVTVGLCVDSGFLVSSVGGGLVAV